MKKNTNNANTGVTDTTTMPHLLKYASYIVGEEECEDGKFLMGFARLARRDANDGFIVDIYLRYATFDGKFHFTKDIESRQKLLVQGIDDARKLFGTIVAGGCGVIEIPYVAEDIGIAYEVLESTNNSDPDRGAANFSESTASAMATAI